MENYIRTEYEVQDPTMGFNGTSLQGYTDPIGFNTLIQLFGEPSINDAIDDKVNVEWLIEGKRYYIDEYGEEDWDYVKATIYNWKTGGVPFGEYFVQVGVAEGSRPGSHTYDIHDPYDIYRIYEI